MIRSESRLVLVDTVVTDKKGNYVHDLTQKDFKVYEDNKEQPITTFSFETGATPPTTPASIIWCCSSITLTPALTADLRARRRDEIHR